MKLYEQLAGHISGLIQDGTLRPGERVPSVRETVRERQVSPATAMRAYQLLETRGLIETRPRSGYYVSDSREQRAPEPRARCSTAARSRRVSRRGIGSDGWRRGDWTARLRRWAR